MEVSHPILEMIQSVTTEEKLKAFLGVENVGRMAAIFFLTIIIILAFIFQRRFLPRRTLQHIDTVTAENIYESIPVP